MKTKCLHENWYNQSSTILLEGEVAQIHDGKIREGFGGFQVKVKCAQCAATRFVYLKCVLLKLGEVVSK